MTRHHGIVVRQDVQDIHNAGSQSVGIASRQVGPADAPLEQDIAANDARSSRIDEHHMAR